MTACLLVASNSEWEGLVCNQAGKKKGGARFAGKVFTSGPLFAGGSVSIMAFPKGKPGKDLFSIQLEVKQKSSFVELVKATPLLY